MGLLKIAGASYGTRAPKIKRRKPSINSLTKVLQMKLLRYGTRGSETARAAGQQKDA